MQLARHEICAFGWGGGKKCTAGVRMRKLTLSQSAGGRILLHLGCLIRGGRLSFHLKGVRRECAHFLGSDHPSSPVIGEDSEANRRH